MQPNSETLPEVAPLNGSPAPVQPATNGTASGSTAFDPHELLHALQALDDHPVRQLQAALDNARELRCSKVTPDRI